MLHQPEFTKSDPGSYEEIGRRIQRMIADPRVQRLQSVTVYRLPFERDENWRQVLTEISETEGIEVSEQQDQGVRIGWRKYCEV
jgi:hypothetical protein